MLAMILPRQDDAAMPARALTRLLRGDGSCRRPQRWAVRLATVAGVVLAMRGAAVAQPAIGITYDINDSFFYRVDLQPGSATPAGSRQVAQVQAMAFDPAGELYGIAVEGFGRPNWGLFRYDPATFDVLQVVPADPSFLSVVTGLSFDSCGKLWATTGPDSGSPFSGSLAVVDVGTGATTVVGQLGLPIVAIAALGDRLYGLTSTADGMWGLAGINRSTGVATALGSPVPSGGIGGSGLAFDGVGRLWALAYPHASPGSGSPIARFDPSTGTAVATGAVSLPAPVGLAIAPPLGGCSAAATCVPSSGTLCLDDLRFAVSVTWKLATGSGTGQAIPLTPNSGGFWFFSADNVELIVKVLNGCDLNGRYWVFAAGLTNVDTMIGVTDLSNGKMKTYSNAANTPFQPIQDTSAFATCP